MNNVKIHDKAWEARRLEALEYARENGWYEAPENSTYLCYGYWTDVYCGLVAESSKARMTVNRIETIYYRDENNNILDQWYFVNPKIQEKFSLRKCGTWMKTGIKDMWSRLQTEPYTYEDPSF